MGIREQEEARHHEQHPKHRWWAANHRMQSPAGQLRDCASVPAPQGVPTFGAGFRDVALRPQWTGYSVLRVRLVLMRLSRLPTMKVLSTQRLQSLQSVSSASD